MNISVKNNTDQLLHINSREELEIYNSLTSVIWVFNIQDHQLWWANNSALEFWEKENLEDFLEIDLGDDSLVVRERLSDIFNSASAGKAIEENWTLYPGGTPKMVILVFTPILIEDGKRAVLIEASPQLKEELDPRAKRILEAVRYTPLMISTFSKNGRLLAQNPAAANVYGQRNEDETTLANRYKNTDIQSAILKIQEQRKRFVTDIQVETQYGSRWHNLHASPGRDPVTGGQVLVLTEEDISDRIKAEEDLHHLNTTLEQRVRDRTSELSKAIQEAKNANRAKTEFLATMSHELRTPLNAIIGFSEMISHGVYGPTTEKQLTTLGDINRSGRYLLKQINDLLDASTIDRGELNLFESTFPIQSTLDYCATIFEMEAKRKNQVLAFEFPQHSIDIHADEHRFTQIITNLVSNALKYTPENGKIVVTTEKTPTGDICVSVRDNGVGIAQEHLNQVTQAFTQVDISSSFVSGKGVGLGLYITSSLLKAHGGRLSLEPNADTGLTARAILPNNRITQLS